MFLIILYYFQSLIILQYIFHTKYE